MSISMQGTWTVSVKSKEPFSSPQQFIITGATSGNGTYVGNTTTPPVTVTGDAWSIIVQHNSGSGFVDSFDQTDVFSRLAVTFWYAVCHGPADGASLGKS